MKKVLIGVVALAFIIGSGILYLKQQAKLPMPKYPLEADDIAAALEKWNPWDTEYVIEEDEFARLREEDQQRAQFNINNADDDEEWLLAALLSGQKDGEYSLNMLLLPFHSRYPLPVEDCKNFLAFSSELFGNFKNTNSLYNKFISDYKKARNIIYTQEQRLPTGSERTSEKTYIWETKVDGIDCRILIEQPLIDSPEAYILSIWISTDRETFFGKE